MLLDLEQIKAEESTQPPIELTWQQQFRQQILAHHNQVMKMNKYTQTRHNYYEDDPAIDRIFQLLQNHDTSTQQSMVSLPVVVELGKSVHQEYSNFVPITRRCYDGDGYAEIEKQFPYAHYLSSHDYKVKLEEFWADVRNSCTGSVTDFRSKMCQKYNPEMNFTEKIEYYIKLLCYGTRVLQIFPHQFAMLYNLTRYQKYLQGDPMKTKNNISITVQKQQQINCGTISYTMKTLYCPVCFLYDCPVHVGHHTYINSERLEFVSPNNKIDRAEHIQYAIKMLDGDNQLGVQKVACSEQCYLRLGELGKSVNFMVGLMARQSAMSDLTKAIIQIGLHMYSYSPCHIRKLLPENKLSCSQIYKYIQTQLNIYLRISNKMHSSEHDSLILQQSQKKPTYYHHLVTRRRKKNKAAKSRKKKDNGQISICVHHFLSQPSVDQYCANCICTQRGYCTAACLCTNECPILRIGCRCRKTKGMCCKSESCACYQQNIECDPDVCGKCCSDEQNRCMNRQIQMRKLKRCLIGPSTIEGAGFGLFAGQNIEKDSLVTIYLGEVVNEQTTQFREQFRRNNSFYNFEQNDTYLDSRFIGNKSRFINHNTFKHINLRVRSVKSLGETWTAFYATKDIYPHQELFFNYDGDGEIAKNHADKYPFIRPE